MKRLLTGELRQEALAGLMVDAVGEGGRGGLSRSSPWRYSGVT
jgi:hypothetical protein